MKAEVERAVAEIRAAYPDTSVTITDDGEGGAYVTVEEVPLSDRYEQPVTWAGFRITFQYPYADTYPHFVRGDLVRRDGGPLGDGISPGTFLDLPALQVSRRSNHLDPRTETALLKLEKVLQWLRTRP